MLDRALHHLPNGIKQKEILQIILSSRTLSHRELSKGSRIKKMVHYTDRLQNQERVQQSLIIFIYQERIKDTSALWVQCLEELQLLITKYYEGIKLFRKLFFLELRLREDNQNILF